MLTCGLMVPDVGDTEKSSGAVENREYSTGNLWGLFSKSI
jgi:hypothetical protein